VLETKFLYHQYSLSIVTSDALLSAGYILAIWIGRQSTILPRLSMIAAGISRRQLKRRSPSPFFNIEVFMALNSIVREQSRVH